MKSPDDEYSDGLEAELESLRQENATLHERYRVARAAHITQQNVLEAETMALLMVIEAKDAMLEKIACVGNGNSHGNSIGNCMAIDALAILPSTELLEARDRKRDAKLLRLVANSGALSSYGIKYVFHKVKLRESGEWIPELGD